MKKVIVIFGVFIVVLTFIFMTPTTTNATSYAPGRWFPYYSACACPDYVQTCVCVYLDEE